MNREGTPVPALHMRTINISLEHCSVLNTHTHYIWAHGKQFYVSGEVPSGVRLRVDVSLVVKFTQ